MPACFWGKQLPCDVYDSCCWPYCRKHGEVNVSNGASSGSHVGDHGEDNWFRVSSGWFSPPPFWEEISMIGWAMWKLSSFRDKNTGASFNARRKWHCRNRRLDSWEEFQNSIVDVVFQCTDVRTHLVGRDSRNVNVGSREDCCLGVDASFGEAFTGYWTWSEWPQFCICTTWWCEVYRLRGTRSQLFVAEWFYDLVGISGMGLGFNNEVVEFSVSETTN